MQLTFRSQEAPPPALAWHAYPDDTGAKIRVYGQDLALSYEYPAFSLSTAGALVQDPAYRDAKFKPFKIQFNLLCDKLSQLAEANRLNNDTNREALAKFRKDLLCGYDGVSTSKYAQQDAKTFEEMKYNLELIINNIIRHNDVQTLKNIFITLAVCEGGVYVELKRLKESLTEANGLSQFLQLQRVSMPDALAQQHIAKCAEQGRPIRENMHAHLSIFIAQVLYLMGESLPPMNVKDIYIPKVKVDPDNSDNIIFVNVAEARIAEGTYQMNHEALMQLRVDFKKLNTADSMIQALSRHLHEKILALYGNYGSAMELLEEKLSNNESISLASTEAPGVALISGIAAMFTQLHVEHLAVDAVVNYDEFDMTKPMTLKSQKELLYYLHAAASFALFYQVMAINMEYIELRDNYELSLDGARAWVSRADNESNTIQSLESIPDGIVEAIIKQKNTDVHLVCLLRNAHRGHRSLYRKICKVLKEKKTEHNLAQLQDEGIDYVIESNADLLSIEQHVNTLDPEALFNLLKHLVKNNRADVLHALPMNSFIAHEIYDVFIMAVESGFSEVVFFLLPYYNPSDDNELSFLLQRAVYSNSIATVGHLLEEWDATFFINRRIDQQASTPLITAVKQKNHQMVELLLSFGANVDLKRRDGQDAFSFARDSRMFILLVNYSTDVNILSSRGQALFEQNNPCDSELVRAYISRGASFVKHVPGSHVCNLIDLKGILVNNLIEYPEKLSLIERERLIDCIIDNKHVDCLMAAITTDFLRKLVFSNLPTVTKPYHRAEALVEILCERQIFVNRKSLFSSPDLLSLSNYFGFSGLCHLAQIELGSDSALRWYAKDKILRLTAEGKDDPSIISAFNDVISSKNGRVAPALSRALQLIRPAYSWFYLYTPYVPADMPPELSNRLRA